MYSTGPAPRESTTGPAPRESTLDVGAARLFRPCAGLVVASVLILPSRRDVSGHRSPRSTRLNLADLSDAPAHEITSPALSNQGAGPMKPAVGQVKWLIAALAIRRSHCQRYARPLHPTTQTWSDRELRPHQRS